MASDTVTRLRLSNGIWEGWLPGHQAPPKLRLRHRDEIVGEPETVASDESGGWLVRFRLPLDRLSDGVQTFIIEDAKTGEALARETVIAGDASASDLRAEVELLKAELDLLKRAFRTHCSETG